MSIFFVAIYLLFPSVGMRRLLCLFALVCGSSVVPIRFSSRIPEIEIYISYQNQTVLRRWVSLSTRVITDDSDFLRFHDPDAPIASERVVADVGLFGSTSHWREDVVRSPERDLDDIRLSVSPMSEFSYSVFSFTITPFAFVINERNPRIFCANSNSLHLFAAISDNDNWGFYINNQQYILDSTDDHIVLSEAENSLFWSQVHEIFIDTQIRMTEDHVVLDCDIDSLDELLPTFSFMINDREALEIFISPREYIWESSLDGNRSCYIAVRGGSLLVLGAPLFRKHTVIFETDTARIGICPSATVL